VTASTHAFGLERANALRDVGREKKAPVSTTNARNLSTPRQIDDVGNRRFTQACDAAAGVIEERRRLHFSSSIKVRAAIENDNPI
jgi:hypothetical protein